MTTLDTKIADLESIIDFTFNEKLWAAKSLNTCGNPFIVLGSYPHLPRNDLLAVYGDAVAASSLCRRWLEANLPKGDWTAMRNAMLGNASLAGVGFRARLDDCVYLNPGTTAVSEKTMATTVEAILGAVHLDGGEAAMARVMETLGMTHARLEPVPSYTLPGCPSQWIRKSRRAKVHWSFIQVDLKET